MILSPGLAVIPVLNIWAMNGPLAQNASNTPSELGVLRAALTGTVGGFTAFSAPLTNNMICFECFGPRGRWGVS